MVVGLPCSTDRRRGRRDGFDHQPSHGVRDLLLHFFAKECTGSPRHSYATICFLCACSGPHKVPVAAARGNGWRTNVSLGTDGPIEEHQRIRSPSTHCKALPPPTVVCSLRYRPSRQRPHPPTPTHSTMAKVPASKLIRVGSDAPHMVSQLLSLSCKRPLELVMADN